MNHRLVLNLIIQAIWVIPLIGQTSLGTVQANTNEALPNSYNFQEYVYAEPDDQGICLGIENSTASIDQVFFAQTHRHAIDHPFFFTIGHRPLLLQLAVLGTGQSPDVTVEGILDGNSLGTLCLAGPEELSTSIDLDMADFENYFSVTLPKDWVKNGLELHLKAGNDENIIDSDALNIGPYTELNLVMVQQDVLDYNTAPHNWPIFDDFLEELASSIPASVIRFGIFPEILTFPELVASNNTESLVRLKGQNDMPDNGIFSDGSINSVAILFLENLHQATADYNSTVYFGNTLNLAPGGWGGGKSFVSFDFTDIFIHELGHALSLPHWGESAYNINNPNEYEFLYPYGGENDDGGGRGTSWNFIQDTYEFVSPECQDASNDNIGLERSDCMQRNYPCIENRIEDTGPWDGFGDFSALAMHRYLVGASVESGQVLDRGEMKDFQFNMQGGFPIVSLENGKRIYTRDPLQPADIPFDQQFIMPGEEQINQDVYLIYGTAHESQEQANIVYKPIAYNGTLPPIIDPTNPETFEALKDPIYVPHFYEPRDIIVKLIYEDGSVLHALNPFHSFQRSPYSEGYGIWRRDLCNFSLVVPRDKALSKVEVYKRPFCLRWDDIDTEGNINYADFNITAENFMDDAVWLSEYEFGAPPALGSNTIGNRVWHDLNQNGIDDPGESGIADVSLVLWKDGDGDSIPDWMGFAGVEKTDENGYYSFTGLTPGNYLVFVWSVDNWELGQPLAGMVPTEIFVDDPNTDINLDNNGRPGNIDWGLTNLDIVSGMITLTEDGEPLNDGDREDDWFDYDPSGNMTIDFGFYVDGATQIETDEHPLNVQVYPNPLSDYFILESEEFLNHQMEVLHLDGRIAHTQALIDKQTKIILNELSPGMFILVIKNKEGKIVWKKSLVKS